jgi:uncharacterized protein
MPSFNLSSPLKYPLSSLQQTSCPEAHWIFRKSLAFALSLLFVFCLQANFQAEAQNLPPSPNPPRLVNDLADVLSAEQERILEQKLLAYEDSTTNQVAIVLIKTLDGYDVADYAVQLALAWGIGSKKNNGVLLLVAMEDKKSRIEVGYGLEPVITDAVSARILREDLKPNFKDQRYFEGLDLATDHIFKAAAGEFKAEAGAVKKKKKRSKGWGIGTFFVFVLVVWLISRNSRGGRGGGGGFLTGMLLGSLLNSGRRHSNWGDFSSGSGSFGGFGGGSFGGGGASGDW